MKIRSKLEADQKMMQELTWLAEMMPKYILYTTSILCCLLSQGDNPQTRIAQWQSRSWRRTAASTPGGRGRFA
jgi:hypothetical protein